MVFLTLVFWKRIFQGHSRSLKNKRLIRFWFNSKFFGWPGNFDYQTFKYSLSLYVLRLVCWLEMSWDRNQNLKISKLVFDPSCTPFISYMLTKFTPYFRLILLKHVNHVKQWFFHRCLRKSDRNWTEFRIFSCIFRGIVL